MATAALRFEMRVATFSPATPEDTWACALEMARWADELGFLSITLSEHHCVEDGHISSPLTRAWVLLAGNRVIDR